SGSGGTTLTFNYTVAAGQNTSDLDVASMTALSLAGGTITDTANVDNANLTLPGSADPGALSANKAIVIDTIAPAIASLTSTTANSSYKAGVIIPITINFNEIVNVIGTPQLTLNDGAVVNYASGSGSVALIFNYTVAAGQNTSDLDEASASALALNGGTIKDVATNNATLTLPAPGATGSLGANKAIVIDTTAPTVINVTSSTADGLYGAAAVISIQVTFSEPVSSSPITPTLALNTGASASTPGGSATDTFTFTYTVAAGQSTSDIDYASVSALAAGGGIKDAAGNNGVLTFPAPAAAGSLGANKN